MNEPNYYEPCFYQLVRKDDGTFQALARAMARMTIIRFVAVSVVLAILSAATFLFAKYQMAAGHSLSIPRLLMETVQPAVILLTFICAAAALRQLYIVSREDCFQQAIRKLDWYLGETPDLILLLNMDILSLDKGVGSEEQYEACCIMADALQEFQKGIPQDAPVLAAVRDRARKVRRHTRALYRLAMAEVCMRQMEQGNLDFFGREDFWGCYRD